MIGKGKTHMMEDSVTSEQIEKVKSAIRDYHFALDTRKHGGVAQDTAVHAIEQALGMPWVRGEELERRTRG
jgi:chromosome condensin MukBEF ATPase and DNA-binding subunit MukB